MLWIAALFFYRAQKAQHRPAVMAAAVQHSLNARNAELGKMLEDTGLVQQLLQHRLSAVRFGRIAALPFAIAAYRGDSLIFWNDNNLLPPFEAASDTTGHLVFLNNTYCIRKTINFSGSYSMGILLPVKKEYPFENQYLQSGFDGLPQLPGTTEIIAGSRAGTYAVTSSGGHKWFSLDFTADSGEGPLPGRTTLLFAALAAILSLIWIQVSLLDIIRRRGWQRGLLVTFMVMVVLRTALEIFPLPFRIHDLDLFSPVVYGYNRMLPSLGDLLLNEILAVWILLYLLVETPYKIYWRRLRSRPLRITAAGLIICLFTGIFYLLFTVLYSLVMDSQISFDLSHFHTIDAYSIIGLVSIGLGLSIAAMFVRLVKCQLDQLIPVWWLGTVLVAGMCCIFIRLWSPESVLFYVAIFWLTGYMLLQDLLRRTISRVLSLPVILLSVFTCLCATVILHELIQIRDLEKNRISFASHLLAWQDPQMEYNFRGTAQKLTADPQVQAFVRNPSAAAKLSLSRRLSIRYFNLLINRYQPELYFYDRQGQSIQNADTTALSQLNEMFGNGMPTQDDYLVFAASAGGGNYLARIPLDTARQPIGYLFISFGLKKNINETIYPELLQPATVNHLERNARYAYAIYAHGSRIAQTSNYNFPAIIDTGGGIRPPQVKKVRKGFYELRYQETPDYIVVVAGSTGSWLSAAVLLSYLFGVQLLISLIALAYRLLLRYSTQQKFRSYHFTLRQRMHLGTLLILLLSFILLGMVTITFFKDRYTQTNRQEVHKTTQAIERYLHQYLSAAGGLEHSAALDSIIATPEFRYALYTITASQKIDANIFGLDGRLLAASQEELYGQGMQSPVLQPEAFRRLQGGSFITEVREQIGGFRFLSCCMPLRNDEGRIMAYISVPFFSSQKELNDQVSNFVVALIILYALLFFLSSFLAYIISTRLTGTFNVLIDQFGRLNLQKNERLDWPYDDEIGLLVREYNKMLQKVEENAVMLVQSEREGAWREMARQVAHEIKNPLTPMKLNIQFLQQALRSQRPGVEELAEKVSASIIEQIDNLNYIASEFSNFASMPEARAEVFELNAFLLNALPLYQQEAHIRVSVELPVGRVMVMADHSQLLRVFTNLMQNAIQAIPEERAGDIRVTLTTDNTTALLAVSDNGVGINEEAASKIFKPYFTTKSSGTGLGLAMSRKIVELWKGSIWFESVPGEGTTFFIKLPVEQSGAALP